MEARNTGKPDAEEADSEREVLRAGLRVLARIIAREEIKKQRGALTERFPDVESVEALSIESTEEELLSHATH